MDLLETLFWGLLVGITLGALFVSVWTVRRLALSAGATRWEVTLRDRLVFGVPWGSAIVIAFVLSFYLFVQDGITDFSNPVTIPYRAWSYYYPLGMIASSFSHASANHLIGNLAGAAVVAPIAEYAWGHYPNSRADTSSERWWMRPWVRAVVIFPLVVIGIGLLSSLFLLGPVIGFSGLVFAFVGFAIVRYPLTTLIAATAGQGALLTIYRGLQAPVTLHGVSSSAPSWSNIAIQGHALGFLIGLIIGILVFRRRSYTPDPLRVWLAVLFWGFSSQLWAIYWYGPENTFILFRGPGAAIVTILALVVTLAIAASEKQLLPARLEAWLETQNNRFASVPGIGAPNTATEPHTASLTRAVELGLTETDEPTPDRRTHIRAIATNGRTAAQTGLSRVTRRQAAFVLVVIVLALISGPAVPTNLFVLTGETQTNASVSVEDYTITYDENVDNELISFIGIDALEQSTEADSSGIIVASEQRNLWVEAVSADQLERSGEATVYVGSPGWREAVHAEREGWTPVGNSSVYHVSLWTDDEADTTLAYTSSSARADVSIENTTVSLSSADGEFTLEVVPVNDSTSDPATAQVPDDGESVSVGGLTVTNDDGTLYAASNGTEVRIASEE